MFRELNIDSRRIAKAIERDRRQARTSGPLQVREAVPAEPAGV